MTAQPTPSVSQSWERPDRPEETTMTEPIDNPYAVLERVTLATDGSPAGRGETRMVVMTPAQRRELWARAENASDTTGRELVVLHRDGGRVSAGDFLPLYMTGEQREALWAWALENRAL